MFISNVKFKNLLLVVCVLVIAISLVPSVLIVKGQPEMEVHGDDQFFLITEGQTQIDFTFNLLTKNWEFADNITVIPSDLKDTRGKTGIASWDIDLTLDNGEDATEVFVVNKGDVNPIYGFIKTEDLKPGTYKGTILFHAINASNVVKSLEIQVRLPTIWPAGLMLGGILFGVVFTLFGIQPPTTGEVKSLKTRLKTWLKYLEDQLKKYWLAVVITGAIVAVLFFLSFTAYIPTITDFGANEVDYFAAILFGIGQYGAGTAGGTIAKLFKK